MPEMTGLELLAHIRATGSTVPVILASGYDLEGLETTLAQDPHLRYLPKPFTLQQLFALAQDLLRHWRGRQDTRPQPGGYRLCD